jgi:hypothetical protein
VATETDAIIELRYRAFTIGEWMKEARGLIAQAIEEAQAIEALDTSVIFERFDWEVSTAVESIRANLQEALVDRTDCSVNVLGEEARDLIDLIDLALSPREPAAA